MNTATRSIIGFCLVLIFTSCASTGKIKAKDNRMVVPGGTIIPTLSIGFDVTYDKELDNVIPGYKIMVMGITNKSMRTVPLDPFVDKWVVIDRKGSKHKGVINLRNDDPDTWAKLPQRLQKIIEYPLLVQAGKNVTVDVLVDNSVNLAEYKSLNFLSRGLDATIVVIPRQN